MVNHNGVSKIYKNAPVSEALIDFKFILSPHVTFDLLSQVGDAVGYVKSGFLKSAHFELSDDRTFGTQSNVGLIFKSDKEEFSLQLRLDGFAISKNAPYRNWEEFRTEALRVYEHFYVLTSLQSITRLALRYINRIDIPLPVSDFDDYFTTFPKIPLILPQAMSNFFMQVVLPWDHIGTIATVNQSIAPRINLESVPIMLDIELSRGFVPPITSNDAWAIFDQLRIIKNTIFESYITDKTRGLFV